MKTSISQQPPTREIIPLLRVFRGRGEGEGGITPTVEGKISIHQDKNETIQHATIAKMRQGKIGGN